MGIVVLWNESLCEFFILRVWAKYLHIYIKRQSYPVFYCVQSTVHSFWHFSPMFPSMSNNLQLSVWIVCPGCWHKNVRLKSSMVKAERYNFQGYFTFLPFILKNTIEYAPWVANRGEIAVFYCSIELKGAYHNGMWSSIALYDLKFLWKYWSPLNTPFSGILWTELSKSNLNSLQNNLST